MTREDVFPLRTLAAAIAARHPIDRRTLRKGRQPAKYRDAATGATWSGLGKAPRWIAGLDHARFLIGATATGAGAQGNTSAGSMIAAVPALQQAPTLSESPISFHCAPESRVRGTWDRNLVMTKSLPSRARVGPCPGPGLAALTGYQPIPSTP